MLDNGFTKREKMSCKCAIRTDEYHGWECSITEGRSGGNVHDRTEMEMGNKFYLRR